MASASRANGSLPMSLVSWPTKKRAPWHATRGPQEETPKAKSGDFTSCRIHCCVLIQAMCTQASGKQSCLQSKEAKPSLPTGQRCTLCFCPSLLSIPSTRGLFLLPLPTLQRGHSSRTLNFILFFCFVSGCGEIVLVFCDFFGNDFQLLLIR